MPYKLTLIHSGRPGPHLSWLLNLPTTLGRAVQHGICIQHDSVSRTHCRLALNGEGALTIRDLDSLNGTYVNDQRVQHALLTPGDQIQLGAVAFRLELVTAGEIDATPEPPETYDLSVTNPLQPALRRRSGSSAD